MRTAACIVCVVLLAVVVALTGITLAVNATVLNTTFVIDELEKTDLHLLLAEEAKDNIPSEAGTLLPVIEPIIDQAAIDLQPWLSEQLRVAVNGAHAYLKERQPLRFMVSLAEPKVYVAQQLEQRLRAQPGLVPGIPAEAVDAFLAVVVRELDRSVPDLIEVDEALLGAETMEDLQAARRYTGYVRTSVRVLPVIGVLLVVSIAPIQRWQGRLVWRYVGAGLLAGGVLAGLAGLAVKSVLPEQIGGSLPGEIAAVVPEIVSSCCGPLFTYSGVVALTGGALVLMSMRLRQTGY